MRRGEPLSSAMTRKSGVTIGKIAVGVQCCESRSRNSVGSGAVRFDSGFSVSIEP